MAVEIRNRIQREVAIEVGVRELLEGVTIAAIAARAGDGAPPPPSRLIEPDDAGRFTPFPLTEIQQAYWIGRGDTLELGNVGCYLYTEVELKGVDLARLERAWNMLVRRHDMLRAVVLPDGQQQILPTVPEYSIAQRDLSGDDAEAELLALRERLSHRLPDPAVWPLFDLRATHHPGGTRLHIGLDLLVLDAASIFQLREEWGRLYEDPTTALPPIGLSFRDYVLEGAGLARAARPGSAAPATGRSAWRACRAARTCRWPASRGRSAGPASSAAWPCSLPSSGNGSRPQVRRAA